ncbi:zinc ribbon domain-containing protein [Erysipelothrix sp. HDW6C]|uniref:zinc ribbon domain-containing protein n=1 Tax=Erysipelothrix sp. HDW6C TaxID=2714930 RepID=UPI00196B921D|nr:zinc ribbon domain-containing protein [Erysipelothrix sp. HDW6C]
MCQSCGMPLNDDANKGTDMNGKLSEEYCVYCLKDGAFIQDITLEQAIAQAGEYASLAGVTKEEAIAYSRTLFPTLKRWKGETL